MRVALKVDVLDLHGALEGVPALLELFAQYGVTASFLLSLGPDSGAGVFQSLFSNRDIGHHAAGVLREIQASEHELGVCAYDAVRWQRQVTRKDEAWTRRQIVKSVEAFEALFGRRPQLHAAAGWQLNAGTPLLEAALGFRYASDTRGSHPFLPNTAAGTSSCPQIPTTLPVIEELLLSDEIDIDNVHEYIYMESQRPASPGHVFSLQAGKERDGWLSVIERLIVMWQGSQQELVPLQSLYENLDMEALPYHQVGLVRMVGFKRPVAVQIAEDNHTPAYSHIVTHKHLLNKAKDI